jgi:hypothetical protein
MSRFKATRATERMREMVAENGPCSELTALRVPLPLNPCLLLEGLLPQVGWGIGNMFNSSSINASPCVVLPHVYIT